MAESNKTVAVKGSTAVESPNRIENPGFEPEHKRIHDVDPDKAAKAERGISLLFLLSGVLSASAFAFYFLFPIVPGDLWSVRLNTLLVGVAISAGLLALGVGTVHWAKALMHGHELVEDANASRRWLSQQPEVRANHISLMGWSNGASTALKVSRPSAPGAV